MDPNIEKLSVQQNLGANANSYRRNPELFERELDTIKTDYPNLHYRNTPNGLVLEGEIAFDITCKEVGERIKDSYLVQIAFPDDYPRSPPTVKESVGRITSNFHKSGDTNCLGVPSEIYLKFAENPTILHFIRGLLEPYLYTHSYWNKHNGKTPFGERPHGGEGVLEYYSGIFGTKDNDAIISLLEIPASKAYKQSMICPCGNGKKLKKCHGKIILNIQNKVPTTILDYELRQIKKHVYGFWKL